ncbi:MAG: hypothetical protein IJX14_04100, partial [Clostridia bacterium]|nr:hypothetical protein [Clostridia bacterium]
MQLSLNHMQLTVDFRKKTISSLIINDKERLAAPAPLVRIRLMDREGKFTGTDAYDAAECTETGDGAVYTGFSAMPSLKVQIHLNDENGEAAWRLEAQPGSADYLVEWVDFPLVTLPALEDNNTEGSGGSILFPYNEGAVVSDMAKRESSHLRHMDPAYPSEGCYAV